MNGTVTHWAVFSWALSDEEVAALMEVFDGIR